MRTPRITIGWGLALAMGGVGIAANPALAAMAPMHHQAGSSRPAPTARIAPPLPAVALVVQAPIKPADYGMPVFEGPGFPAETNTPEPASLITGLLGGGLALTAWARRRRKAAEGPAETEDLLAAA